MTMSFSRKLFREKPHGSSLGFSLIELLMVVSVLGVIGLATSSMLLWQIRSNANLELKIQIQDALQLQKLALTNVAVCSRSLRDKDLQSDGGFMSIPESNELALVMDVSRDPSNPNEASFRINQNLTGGTYTGKARVTRLRLLGQTPPTPKPGGSGIQQADGVIEISVTLNDPHSGVVERRIPITYEFNSDNKLTSCQASSENSNTARFECERLGRVFVNGSCQNPTGQASCPAGLSFVTGNPPACVPNSILRAACNGTWQDPANGNPGTCTPSNRQPASSGSGGAFNQITRAPIDLIDAYAANTPGRPGVPEFINNTQFADGSTGKIFYSRTDGNLADVSECETGTTPVICTGQNNAYGRGRSCTGGQTIIAQGCSQGTKRYFVTRDLNLSAGQSDIPSDATRVKLRVYGVGLENSVLLRSTNPNQPIQDYNLDPGGGSNLVNHTELINCFNGGLNVGSCVREVEVPIGQYELLRPYGHLSGRARISIIGYR